MKNCTVILIALIGMISCKQKEQGNPADKKYISTISLIMQQINHIDTGLYSIIKTVSINDQPADTTYIPREEFAAVAKEFLEIPDLSQAKDAKRFKEESTNYDSLFNRVIFTYVARAPEKEPVKKIELLVKPIFGQESQVTNIIIDWGMTNRDSSIKKKMLWLTDRSFQVFTTIQQPGKPEKTIFTKVSWNEGFDQ